EAAKFVGDFKSLAKEADESLAKHKTLELEIKRLSRAVVSQDIMSVVQKTSVVDTSNLQTELERIDNTKTRRPHPRSNTKNDRVLFASKSSRSKNNGADVEEHHRNFLLSKNTKHMSSAGNNIKLDSQNVISKVICAMCKQCLISINHDACLRNYVNGKNSRGKKQKANVSIKEKQKKHQPKGDVSMANRLTTDGIMDGLFKKKENSGNKRRSNDQNRNRGMDDRNKRQITRKNFALTAPEQGQVQRQYASHHPKCAKCNFHHFSNYHVCGRCNQVGHFTRYCTSRAINERPRPTCFECGDPNHFRRNRLRMNQATTLGGNRSNLMLAIEGNTNQGNNKNQAHSKAFALGVAEAPQDPNIVTGTFPLNDHFITVLFDSDADYSFISTNFLPLINMKPSVISPGYEIEIASGVIVKTNKIIRGCRLELEGHTFIINLILFGYGSFNVIVGMDWLSKLRAKIFKTVKVNKPKLEDIPVVRKFPGVFSEYLSGLSLSREVEFRIDLILGAMPVAKSPYRLAPTKMKELPYLDKFFIVFFDDILIYSKSKEEHEVHLNLILELLENENLFRKFSKCEFWLQEAIYRKLLEDCKPLTLLNQKDKKFKWGDEQENTFQTLNDMLCDAPILALLEGTYDFVVYCGALNQANVVIDALSRKERLKSRRARARSMIIHSSIKAGILEAQSEASKGVNTPAEMLKGLDKRFERKEDGGLYLAERIWVLVYGNLITLIMNEAHATKYSIHPRADKMYYDL
nr:hypothetical protein [Tanacetum cinerariifolium]